MLETADKDLELFRITHTFKKNCKHCGGRGYTGKLITGPEKGKYVRCRCAKNKGQLKK